MDDKKDIDDLITMEAKSGLAKIFDYTDEKHIRPILINTALRIRPCFEKVMKHFMPTQTEQHSLEIALLWLLPHITLYIQLL